VPPERHVVVAAQMRAHPHATLEQHARLWQEEQGQSLSDTTLWRTLQRMNWSHKKRASRPKSVTKRRVSSGAKKCKP
jgi:transposase